MLYPFWGSIMRTLPFNNVSYNRIFNISLVDGSWSDPSRGVQVRSQQVQQLYTFCKLFLCLSFEGVNGFLFISVLRASDPTTLLQWHPVPQNRQQCQEGSWQLLNVYWMKESPKKITFMQLCWKAREWSSQQYFQEELRNNTLWHPPLNHLNISLEA